MTMRQAAAHALKQLPTPPASLKPLRLRGLAQWPRSAEPRRFPLGDHATAGILARNPFSPQNPRNVPTRAVVVHWGDRIHVALAPPLSASPGLRATGAD